MADVKLSEALDRINEIHGHMARGEVYLGYRPLPVALSGVLGLLAAVMQARFVPPEQPRIFVYYWLSVAGVSAALAASVVLVHFFNQSWFERRQTMHVWGQFLPCLAGGGLMGVGVACAMPESIGLLPGLWAMVFGLGIFSSRPFLPKAVGWVALYYLLAGAWMVSNPADATQPAWLLAWTFFVGQCAGAVILYLNLERGNSEYAEKHED